MHVHAIPIAIFLHHNYSNATRVINRFTLGRVDIDSFIASDDRRVVVDFCILVKRLYIDLKSGSECSFQLPYSDSLITNRKGSQQSAVYLKSTDGRE